MKTSATVQIIGAPIGACGEEEVKDPWRDLAAWVGRQLAARFGSAVSVEYFDLLDPDLPLLPSGTQLPLVLINGEVLSSGAKLSIPAIRKRLEALGITPIHH